MNGVSNRILYMIQYAYKHTKYYRNLLDKLELDPWVMPFEKIFYNMPVITKKEYLAHYNEFISDEYSIDSLNIYRTSGSTGKILDVCWNKYDYVKSSLDMWRARQKYGVYVNSKVCYFHTMLKTNIGNDETIISSPRVFMPSDNSLTFSKLQFNEENLRFYFDKINEFQPKWLLCYPTTLYLFVKFLLRNNLKLTKSIIYIELMGEKALQSHIEQIRNYFGHQVHINNLYGMQETNGLAIECDDGNLHILSNNAYLEIEKNGIINKYGTNGSIIVTSLTNTAMPFIRYETGDVGSLCPSNNLNNMSDILEIISGRQNEIIYRENDTPIEGNVLFYLVEFVNNIFKGAIRQFRIEQNDYKSFHAILSINAEINKLDIQSLFVEKAIQCGLDGNWSFEYVDEIIPENNGKLRYFINNMAKVELNEFTSTDN